MRKIMKIKYSLLALFAALVFVSCEKDSIQTADTNQVVVESYLKAGDTISLGLTRQFVIDSEDSIYEPVNNVEITLTCENISRKMSFNGKGKYSSSLVVEAGKTYSISFTYNGKLVTAETTVPTSPEGFAASVNSLVGMVRDEDADTTLYATYTWDNPDEMYHYMTVECVESTLFPINTSYKVTTVRRFNPIKTTTYTLSDQSFTYYGKHRIVLYKIPDEFAKLYKHYSTNSESLTSPPTNVTNGLGIFTSYSPDTLYLQVTK